MGFITSGPNEALVVSGCCHGQPLIVVGGWAYVIPCIQKVQRLPLCIMTLKVASPHVYTVQGVPLSVSGIAQVHSNYKLIQTVLNRLYSPAKSHLLRVYLKFINRSR